MAKTELTVWENKGYPAEAVQKIESMIEATKVDRDLLDDLDSSIAACTDTPDPDAVKRWARIASGIGNKLRKLATRLEATVRNAEANRYMEILFECQLNAIDFKDGAAKMDASRYVGEVRKARNLFAGYVESADKILTMCRMQLNQQEINQANDVSS